MVIFLCVIVLVLVGFVSPVESCSRVLWTTNSQAVLVGRNMDWPHPMPVNLYVLPRGLQRNGMTGENTLTWTAKYGSIVSELSDGMNEKGLAGHLLWLGESDYGLFDRDRPSLNVAVWLQYYLDNFATVKDAVMFTEQTSFQLVTGTFRGRKGMVHLAIEDSTGDSAIIEYVEGKPKVHHGKQYTVMTNSPPYDEQLENLWQFQEFGGDKPLPGTTGPVDRFVRATYYLRTLPDPKDYREGIASILSVIRNVSQPLGIAAPGRPRILPTRWRTVSDLTNLIYYFESTTNPNLVWMEFEELDFSEGSGIRKLDLMNGPDRIGDCSGQFEPSELFSIPLPDLT